MIRMGRSSKVDDTSKDTSALHTQSSTTAFTPESNQSNEMNRAMSESESMARDIKEGRLSGFVGAGTVLTGETTFQSMLRIDGHLTGRVTSEEGTLIIGSTGQVDANIGVSSAIINGLVNGDIVCGDKLELGRTARVVGNIQAPRLIVSEGAILEGSCSMVNANEQLQSVLEEQRQQYSTSDLAQVQEEVEEETEVEEEVLATDHDLGDDEFEESEDEDESAEAATH